MLQPDVPYDEIEETLIFYKTFNKESIETNRMAEKPTAVVVGHGKNLDIRQDLDSDGWTRQPLDEGGILRVKHSDGNRIKIMK